MRSGRTVGEPSVLGKVRTIGTDGAPLERLLAILLREGGGVITAHRLCEAGINRGAQQRLVERGRLTRIRWGVLVDPSLRHTPDLMLRSALAWAGDTAVASHRSAGDLWGLGVPAPATPQITVSRRRRMRVDGVIVHQSNILIERTLKDGTPVTSPSRTLLDLAGMTGTTPQALEAWIDEALAQRLTAVAKLVSMVASWPSQRCPGGQVLLGVLRRGGYLDAPGASALERRTWLMLRPICEAAGVPLPVREHPVGGYRLDFAWPALLVAVEVDGRRWHRSSADVVHDTTRRLELVRLGWRILVFTWDEIVHQPGQVAHAVLCALQLASSGRR